jgi:GAF domain
MRDPFIAVDVSTDLRVLASRLRRSWESGLGGGKVGTCVRPVIKQSWQRMIGAGLDPDHLEPCRAFARDELSDRRAASPLTGCIDVLRHCLGGFAMDAEHVMVVVDGSGRILWMEGDPRVRRRADRIAFEEGMLWTEASAGTNAIGTALAIDHAVQVFSAEHFLPEQHTWWCSAAPVHDPATGELVGVVDLSGSMPTAHPHSLALVMAAAQMAESVLRFERAVADDRRRRAELARSTVVLSGRRASLDMRLLGRGRIEAQLDDGPVLELSLRQGEILALLAMYPDGLTCEQLTLLLYGDAGNRVSTRAQISRLRSLLGSSVLARPYRLAADVTADFLTVEAQLAAGDLDGALEAYRGPLLPGSDAPRVRQARDELEGALQRAVRAGTPEQVWTWLQTESGREDLVAMADFVRSVAGDDPHRAVISARMHSLQRAWGLMSASLSPTTY